MLHATLQKSYGAKQINILKLKQNLKTFLLEKFTLLKLNKALCYGVFPSVWVVYLRFVANKDISSYIGEKFPINQFCRRHVMSTSSMLASCS